MISEQLSLSLDWGAEPWSGFAPRFLTKGFLRDVEKSRTFPKPATGMEHYEDPAQLCICIPSSVEEF